MPQRGGTLQGIGTSQAASQSLGGGVAGELVFEGIPSLDSSIRRGAGGGGVKAAECLKRWEIRSDGSVGGWQLEGGGWRTEGILNCCKAERGGELKMLIVKCLR